MGNHNNLSDGKITAGSHLSCWMEEKNKLQFQSLKENLYADAIIVGGGIAGVSVAYCLSREGKKVVLVEDGFIGSGETGRTTAHLVTALDDRYYDLEKMYGEKDTALIAGSHSEAIDFVEKTIQAENIDCDFERVFGYLFLHPSDKPESLDKELDAASRAGLKVMKLKKVPGISNYSGECIRYSGQAQFHPLKYISGLCKAIINNGGKIFTETHAAGIDHHGITTDKGFTVKSDHIVIATNTPVNNKYVIHLKQYPYRTYVIGALVKKASLPGALWWDTGDHDTNPEMPPYHYVRLYKYNDTHDLLISGGEDHFTGQADADVIPEENRYAMLEDWTSRHFPIEKVVYKWSGQVMEPADSIAYIGRNPWDKSNVYIVTGDSGNGMTHGTIAGMLIADLINGRENKWEKIYSPSRIKLKGAEAYFKNFAEGILSFFQNSPDGSDHAELSSVKKGEGKIIELHDEKCGVYRDDSGRVHIVSAACTHLKCTVKWNPDEKSWDCPCHGSRFTYKGTVINGPANT